MSEIYRIGALILKNSYKTSLKKACFRHKNAKTIFAMLSKVLPLRETMKSEILSLWPDCPNLELAILMLYDYWSKGKISGGGSFKSRVLSKFPKVSPIRFPTTSQKKWLRLNKFKVSHISLPNEDDLIPGLYQTDPSLYKSQIENYELIVQEKASCMPVLALNLEKGPWNAIDACAAPGNKTIQLAERMKSYTSGKLFALEQNKKRFQVLESRAQKAGATNIVPIHQDFFTFSTPARYVLLDPSCSGSGIVSHQLLDSGKLVYKTDETSERIQKLSEFQQKILDHALSIENVEQVVYSTCSIYELENENVVRQVMKKHWRKFKIQRCLGQWHRRGNGQYGEYMVRTHPLEDNTQGFFVALIQRRKLRLRHKFRHLTVRHWQRKHTPVLI